MKLIFVYAVSWALGLLSSTAVTHFYYREPFSVADMIGFSTLSFVPALVVCALLYTPGLLRLQRRLGKCQPRSIFPLTSTVVLNAPVILIIAWQAGRTMSMSEALSFIVIFLVMGLVSGIGFTWWCNNKLAVRGNTES